MDSEVEITREFAEMAIGRLLKLGSRPEQPGDVAEYNRIRAVVMAYAEQEKNAKRDL